MKLIVYVDTPETLIVSDPATWGKPDAMADRMCDVPNDLAAAYFQALADYEAARDAIEATARAQGALR